MIYLVVAIGMLCLVVKGDELLPVSVFAIATIAAQVMPLGEGNLYLLASTFIDFGIIYMLSLLPATRISRNLAKLTLFSLAFNGACHFAPSMMAGYSLIGVAFYLIVLAVIITGGGHGLRNSSKITWLFRHAHKCN